MKPDSNSSSTASTSASLYGRQSPPSPISNGTLTSDTTNWAVLGSMFKSECTADIEIVLGTGVDIIRFKSHTHFLELRAKALANKVKAKAEGVMASEVKRLFIPDVEPKVFRPFFEYLYSDEFLPDLTLGFSTEQFKTLIDLFRQYCGKQISQILCKLVTRKTLFMLAIIARTEKNEELQKLTRKEISCLNKEAGKFLKTEDFLTMDSLSVAEMIKSDELNVDELTLFKAVVMWATNRPNPNRRSIREQMEDVLPLIRFPLLSLKEFYEVVRQDILTGDEVKGLFLYLGADSDEKPDYDTHPTQPRANIIRQSPSDYDPSIHTDLDLGIYFGIKSEESIQTPTNTPSRTKTPLQNSVIPNLQTPVHNRYWAPSPTFSAGGGVCSNDSNSSSNDSDSDSSSNSNLKIKNKSWKHFFEEVAKLENRWKSTIIGKITCGLLWNHFPGYRLFMQNLEKVVLHVTIPENARNELVQLRRSNFDLRPCIFFKKLRRQKSYDVLWSSELPVDFELVINNVVFFKVNRTEKELLIGFGGTSSDELFPYLDQDCIARYFQRLTLADTDLPDMESTGDSFNELMIWGARDTTLSSLGTFLRKFKNLNKLSCWTKRRHVQRLNKGDVTYIPDKSSIDICRDLVSGRKLTRMAVYYGKFTLQSPFLIRTARKENLTEIYTDYCHWSPIIFEKFHQLFPALKRVSFGYCGHNFFEDILPDSVDCVGETKTKRAKITPKKLVSAVSIRLMTNILKIKSIEYVRVRYLDWLAKPFAPKEKSDLLNFLKSAGIHPHEPKNFVLEKIADQSERESAWKGTVYNEAEEGYEEEMKRLEFQFFDAQKIFRTFKAFKDFNVESSFS